MNAFWSRLTPRERWAVAVGGLVIALTLVWTLIWEPLVESRQALRVELAGQRALIDWLERIAPQVERLRRNEVGTARSLDGRTPLAVVDQSLRSAGLAGALQRIEPGASGEIRVSFEKAAFTDLMRWLETLIATRPLVVVRLEAGRSAQPGRVDCLVVLRLAGS